MTSKGPVVVKQLPQNHGSARRKLFLAEIRNLVDHCYQPQVIVDLSESQGLGPDAIDLLLQCVEHVERADGRVSVAAGSPEAAVILELTRLTSVVDMFSSVSEAVGGSTLHHFEHHDGSQHLAA
jgi:anti-anti-sigma regulatory factor